MAPKQAPSAQQVRAGARGEQVILFRIGQQLFAISANAVQEIRSTDNLAASAAEIPSPELRKVRHTITRGHRTLYVVHGATLFGLPSTPATLVFVLRRSRAALLVEAVESMTKISRIIALPQAFCGQERAWYRGLAVLGDTVVPVINPDGLLTADEVARLDDALGAREQEVENPAHAAFPGGESGEREAAP
jgi:chemotaxis signal transduction protein